MKIAIPVVNESFKKNDIAGGLSVLGCLCIYDTAKNEARWMKTLDLAPNMGELLPALEHENVSVIIAQQVQPMALKVLVNKGFSVYKSDGNHLDDNILLFNMDKLQPYNMDSAMEIAKVCGGECNDCKTDCEEDENSKSNKVA